MLALVPRTTALTRGLQAALGRKGTSQEEADTPQVMDGPLPKPPMPDWQKLGNLFPPFPSPRT